MCHVITMFLKILHLYFLIQLGSSCLFKVDKHRGPWDDEAEERAVDDTCECGINEWTKDGKPSWVLFILKKDATTSSHRHLCTGSIITSNLLATSHKCLEAAGKAFNVYDIWEPAHGSRNMIDKSDIIISTHLENVTNFFSIVQIIYNYRFGVSSATKSDPEDDIVLIQVHPDFKSVSPELSPICIPPAHDKRLGNLVDQHPFYMGFLDNSPSRAWSYGTSCSKEAPFAAQLPQPRSVSGSVVNEDECDLGSDDIDEEDEALLCFKRAGGRPPKWGDGALLMDTGNKKIYLIGITAAPSVEKERPGDDAEYIRFSKVSRLVKYIEYHAARANSKWCPCSGDLELIDHKGSSRTGGEGRKVGDHPWDQPGVSYPRDESLKCVCGLKNGDVGTGPMDRIIGGEPAVPHEYPWMTYIVTYPLGRLLFGKPGKQSYCTGQIINDRMVVTAAHCVGGFKFGATGLKPVREISVDNFDVFINAHRTSGDDSRVIRRKVKKTHLHPDYVDGREGIGVANFSLDIVLLELDSPVTFDSCGDGFRPICLPPPPTVDLKLGGQFGAIAGWGGTMITVQPDGNVNASADIGLPTELQKATIKIQDSNTCKHAYTGFQPGESFPRELCTGNETSLNNVYKGDSGGPLMIQINGSHQYTLVGTVGRGSPRSTSATDERLTHYVFFTPVQSD